MAIPAVRALYEQGFEIHWACGRAAQPLLESYSWINIIPVQDREILVGSPWERIKNIVALWGRIAFRRYDLCATLYYDWRFRLLAFPFQARRKLALSWRSREGLLLPGRHHTDEYMRLLLHTEDSCRERSASPVRPDRLPRCPLGEKGASRRIAIVPGGASNVLGQQILRRWPIENYVKLTQRLIEREYEVVLIGDSGDTWVKSHFHNLPVNDCVGKLSLPEVVSVCDSSDAVVSHDTGPLHLAGMSNACLVGIFGPTNPTTFVSRRPYVTGIWGGEGFACRPCYDGREFAPCKFNGCMHQVTPELVLRELDRLLDARERGEITPWRIVHPEATPLVSID